MRTSSILLLIWCAAGFALAGCGVTAGAGGGNTSPGSNTGGPVSIVTDHSTYGSAESIHVTVTNHLSVPITAYDTRASCSILDLQVLVGGNWQASSAARCALGRIALPVHIASGASYTATIKAGNGVAASTSGFPNGQYRLVLHSSTSSTSTSTSTSTPTSTPTIIVEVDSATLTMSGRSASAAGAPPYAAGVSAPAKKP